MANNGGVMRRFILMFLLAVVSGNAIAKWVEAGADETLHVYYDPATIKKAGKTIKMWSLFDYSEAKELKDLSGFKFMSFRALSEFNCKQDEVRILYASYHPGHMAKGDILSNPSGPFDWQPIPPGSINELLEKHACDRK
jgi:hypothetical protein